MKFQDGLLNRDLILDVFFRKAALKNHYSNTFVV